VPQKMEGEAPFPAERVATKAGVALKLKENVETTDKEFERY
jgi:hypothetical protein